MHGATSRHTNQSQATIFRKLSNLSHQAGVQNKQEKNNRTHLRAKAKTLVWEETEQQELPPFLLLEDMGQGTHEVHSHHFPLEISSTMMFPYGDKGTIADKRVSGVLYAHCKIFILCYARDPYFVVLWALLFVGTSYFGVSM